MQSLKKCQLIQRLTFEWELMKGSFTREELEKEEDYAGLDVRLQLLDSGDWVLHLGDSQYDNDHRGYWGVGFLDYDWEKEEVVEDLAELADELIEEVDENYSLFNF